MGHLAASIALPALLVAAFTPAAHAHCRFYGVSRRAEHAAVPYERWLDQWGHPCVPPSAGRWVMPEWRVAPATTPPRVAFSVPAPPLRRAATSVEQELPPDERLEEQARMRQVELAMLHLVWAEPTDEEDGSSELPGEQAREVGERLLHIEQAASARSIRSLHFRQVDTTPNRAHPAPTRR